jgi:hypothetical protein
MSPVTSRCEVSRFGRYGETRLLIRPGESL